MILQVLASFVRSFSLYFILILQVLASFVRSFSCVQRLADTSPTQLMQALWNATTCHYGDTATYMQAPHGAEAGAANAAS